MTFAKFFPLVLTALYLINILLAFTVIFLERKDPTSTLVWILVLFLLPLIGALLYVLLSQNLTRKKVFKLDSQQKRLYNSLLQKEIEDLNKGKLHFNDPKIKNYKDLIHLHHIQSQAFFTQNNTVDIFTAGQEKFRDLFKQIATAKDHVHVLYFIIKRDSLGKQLIRILTEKAREGVEVRLLVDALGNKLHNKDFKPLIEAGGKVVKFFPSLISYINLQMNYRNHRKLVVIDGQIAYLGGFNIGKEYLGLNRTLGYWRDTHLKISGNAVHEIQKRFFSDWKVAAGEDLPQQARYFPIPKKVGTCGIQIVSSGPDSSEEQIKRGYIKMINAARSSVFIQTPYFIPDESILEALKIAVLSGVEVKIIIPNKPDHLFVYWVTYSYIGELLPYGVKAYIYENGFLHAKTIVVDQSISSVGSANFDIRSFKLNFEINAFIYDSAVSSELARIFEKDLQNSRELTLEEYKKRSKTIKFKESISRLLAPVL